MTCLSPLGDSGLPYQCIHFNGASGTAPQQRVAAPDGAPEFCYIYIFMIYLNCASGAAPQQGVAATDGAPDFYFFNLFILIYLNRASVAAPQQGDSTRRDTRLLFL